MSIELRIPSAGESIQEVQIGQWLKHEGDRVRRDETVVELDTDKASMELPSPSDGILSRIVKQDGEKVGIGDVIALIDPDGQQAPKSDAKSQARAETSKKESNESKPHEPKSRAASGTSPATKTGNANVAPVADETVAAPSVRRLPRMSNRPGREVESCEKTCCVMPSNILLTAIGPRMIADQPRTNLANRRRSSPKSHGRRKPCLVQFPGRKSRDPKSPPASKEVPTKRAIAPMRSSR
jgi:hypothetical protein